MKSYCFIILSLFGFNLFSQNPKASITQYSSFCNNIADYSESEIKIDSVYLRENKWIIEATVEDQCIVKLYPKEEIVGDTLKINFMEITYNEIELENGERFVRLDDHYDCYCLYDVKVECFITDLKHLIINNKLVRTHAFKTN